MKDFYSLLGINKNANKGEIKRAYRDSAKKCHPDVNHQTDDAKRFRDITEAYETLSDNKKRGEYDESRADSSSVVAPHDAEPIRPHRPRHNRRSRTEGHTWRHQNVSFNEGAEEGRILRCDIHLTERETRDDIEYPYTVNIINPCPHCDSVFSVFSIFCPYCGGRRYLTIKKELIITIPKGTQNGKHVRLDLDHVGLSGVKLVVKVFVSSNHEGA